MFSIPNIYLNFEKNLKNNLYRKLEKTFCFDVETTRGSGVLSLVYETELGIVMGKVFFPEEKIYINYQITDLAEKMNLTYNPLKMGLGKRKQVSI